MSVFIGHSSGSKPSVAADAAADILEAELALGGTPAASRYYGTNAGAVRGFYPLPTGDGGGGTTNLGINLTATIVALSSSSGTGVDIPAATTTLAGAMTAADRIKLNGIAAGATANAADSALRDRSTHTGTQSMGTITGLSSALGLKADLSAATFGNLGATDYISIVDTASSYTLTLEFAEGLTNDHTIWMPNASGTLALVGHTHTADNLTDATALGKAVMRLSTPPATRFAAFNAGGIVTLLDEPNFRSAIGAPAADDPRFSDARTPTAHTHPPSQITGSTTLGQALMVAANPDAITFLRVNADNSVTLLDAASFRTAIGAGAGTPAGSGTELQFRNSTTGEFAGVPNSSVSGGSITLRGNYSAVNLTPATAGTQQNSPEIHWQGSGWGSTAGAAQPVEFRAYVDVVSGTSAPTYVLRFQSRTNVGGGGGSGWTKILHLQAGQAGPLVDGGGVSAQFGTTSLTQCNVTSVAQLNGSMVGLRLINTFFVSWSADNNPSGAADLFIGRRASANLRIGGADAASAVAQTISVQSISAGTSNMGAPVFSIDGSQCTGTAVGGTGSAGDVRIRTAPAGASGSAQNAYVESLRARAGKGIALSNGNFAAAGDCIGECTVLRGNTSGTTPAILSESSLGGGMLIPLNAVVHAIVLVQGISEAGDVARFARQVCAKNVAGTSSLVSSNVTIGADDSGTTSLAITVSDTNDTLDIQVTGTSGNNWRWNAVVLAGELVRNIAE